VPTPSRIRLFSVIAAGLVLPLAFAPAEFFWLAPLSYAVLIWSWREAASPGEALRLGLAYGCAGFGVGTYWTFIAVRIIGEAPIAVAITLTVGLVVVLALFVAAAGLVARRWLGTRSALATMAVVPAAWTFAEWLRGWAFTGFGWLAPGYSQTNSWLMAYAPIVGIHGMTLAVLVSSGALVTLAVGTATGRRAAIVVLVAVWGAGALLAGHRWTVPEDKTLDVALLQGNVAQTMKWQPEQLQGTIEIYDRLMLQGAGSDLIIWPEAAIPTLYEYMGKYLASVRAWAERQHALVMLGILHRDPSAGPSSDTFQNVLVALTDPPQIYVKRHLVPFGEYFPVPSFVRNWMRLMNLPTSDAVSGAADQPPVAGLGERFGVTICYEDVFGSEQLHYLPSATFLVNVSNDAWFGDSIAPHQHLQISQVRAAEAGRYLLRSTNTGITAVVDPQGRVVAALPQFDAGTLRYSVRGFTGLTPYARWGNYPIVVLVLAIALAQLATTKFTMRART
jgi:apolipoprotein N-acyltransferase